jgi:hypothetical protein
MLCFAHPCIAVQMKAVLFAKQHVHNHLTVLLWLQEQDALGEGADILAVLVGQRGTMC